DRPRGHARRVFRARPEHRRRSQRRPGGRAGTVPLPRWRARLARRRSRGDRRLRHAGRAGRGTVLQPGRTGRLADGTDVCKSGRVAIAASVTLAVLAVVRFYNQDALDGAQMAQQSATPVAPSIAPQVQGPAVLAGYNPGADATLAIPADREASLSVGDQRLLD